MEDKIGVFIPTYNRANFIKECINSILVQTYKNIQIYIVDNASTDNTFDVVSSINDDRIIYFRNEINVGAIGNFNRCVEIALEYKTNFITIYHSDDIYFNEIIEIEYNFLKSNPKMGAVFTRMSSTDQNSGLLGDNIIFNHETLMNEFMRNGTPLFCPTFMCKAEIFSENYRFSNSFTYFGDTDFYLRLSKKYEIGLINSTLAWYRKSGFQESFIQKENLIGLTEEHNYIMNNILNDINDIDIIRCYQIRASKEYLFYAIEAIKYNSSLNFVNDKIKISIAFKLFPIFSKYGILQRLINYKMYIPIKITIFLRSKVKRFKFNLVCI